MDVRDHFPFDGGRQQKKLFTWLVADLLFYFQIYHAWQKITEWDSYNCSEKHSIHTIFDEAV